MKVTKKTKPTAKAKVISKAKVITKAKVMPKAKVTLKAKDDYESEKQLALKQDIPSNKKPKLIVGQGYGNEFLKLLKQKTEKGIKKNDATKVVSDKPKKIKKQKSDVSIKRKQLHNALTLQGEVIIKSNNNTYTIRQEVEGFSIVVKGSKEEQKTYSNLIVAIRSVGRLVNSNEGFKEVE
jgi:hypothetical protein